MSQRNHVRICELCEIIAKAKVCMRVTAPVHVVGRADSPRAAVRPACVVTDVLHASSRRAGGQRWREAFGYAVRTIWLIESRN